MAQLDEHLLPLTADAANRYLKDIRSRRVSADPAAVQSLRQHLQGDIPDKGQSPVKTLEFLEQYGSPATVASAGGRYFGFVTGGSVPAALAANWLAGAWDQNGFSSVSSPALAAFEDAALRWLKNILGLPGEAGGALVTGATMANFTCLAAARHKALQNVGWDVENDGLAGSPGITIVVGEEVHATVYKVLAMLGLGRNNVIRLPVNEQGAIVPGNLPDLEGPAIVCLQAGNVNSGAFDPAAELISWAKSHGAWIHVDGAFGLWAAASPRLSHLATPFSDADSWATDAHKWLNVPYDNGVAVVQDADALHQAMAINAAYLPPGATRDAIEYTPDSSRRARGVDIWAALNSLGRKGVSDMIEQNCDQALQMSKALEQAGVRILNEVVLNQVVAAFDNLETTEEVIRRVQEDGTCWCGGTTWRGQAAMRISFSSHATTQNDVEQSIDAVLTAYSSAKST